SDKRELVWKIAGLLAVVISVLSTGYVRFAAALAANNPAAFFSDRIAPYQNGLEWSSLFWMFRFPVGTVLILTVVIVAAVWAWRTILVRSDDPASGLYIGVLLSAWGFLLLYPFLRITGLFPDIVRNVRFFYFEFAVLPFYVLVAA